MLNTKSFLAVDFGAGSLKLAEFEVNEASGLRLKQYSIKSLGAQGAQETTREAAILKALQEMLAEKGIKARSVNVCAPGFHVFSKFVKLPPVDAGKVTQIIQYEAQQNVPFPLEDVVWDYQILGSTTGGELEVLLVAIKADIVEGLFRVTETTGLRLQLAELYGKFGDPGPGQVEHFWDVCSAGRNRRAAESVCSWCTLLAEYSRRRLRAES